MSSGGIERAIEAFIEGGMDFAQLRRVIEIQVGRNPARRLPVRKRLDGLKADGRMSAALHGILVEELERSAFGEVTVSAEPTVEEAPAPSPPPPAEIEPTLPDERPAADPPAPADTAAPGSARAPDEPGLPGTGEVLAGRYALESMLGRGGTSVVFRARDLHMPDSDGRAQAVAVKLLSPEFAARADARAALAREAALARRLNHPALVRVFDADTDGPLPYVVMELLEGERLRSLLVRRYPNPLPEPEALPIVGALARVLAYLHGEGIVHRDVKPANVFLAPGGRVRLLDLGLAEMPAEGAGGEAPMRARTPAYASPAALAGEPPSPADDVYALGCVAYEMLAGTHPFGKLPGNEAAAQGAAAPRIASLSPVRWQALRRSLEFDAARRQADGAAFLAEFFASPPPPPPARPWAAGGVLAGLLAGLALGWLAPPPAAVVSGISAWLAPGPGSGASAEPVPVAASPSGPGSAAAGADPGAGPDAAPAAPADPEIAGEGEPPEAPSPAREAVRQEAGSAEAPAGPAADAPAAAAATPGTVAAVATQLSLPATLIRIGEGDSALKVPLVRPPGHAGPLRVEWRTRNGTAEEGRDYAGADWQELEAVAGAREVVVYVPIVSDSLPEPAETFFVEIRRARGGPAVGAPARMQVIITDDD